ncbi:universal stress protein [Variovorax paradoxus]|uniref:universal stress protein n=1 Tax=Variovorax paradoxus TaxID=34073 RepID=UPI0034641A93
MSLYAHILVPVDGSPTADRGLREAIRLASALGSKLRLIHVIDDFPMLVELSTISSFEAGMQQMRQYGESVLTKALSEARRPMCRRRPCCARSRRAAWPMP